MHATSPADLFRLFRGFFLIGAFTIGGGYAMLPLMQREFVERRKWIGNEEMVDVFAVAQSLPGVIAINASLFIGHRVAGIPGALIAALGTVLPSFVVILVIVAFLTGFQSLPLVQKAFAGIRSGVTALILLAGIKLARSVLKSAPAWIIAAAAVGLVLLADLHAAWVILSSAAAGLGLHAIRLRRAARGRDDGRA